MKRAEYRARVPRTVSVEHDRWNEFVNLCDLERKSISLKLDEMIAEELQKNQVGGTIPIGIDYTNQSNNSIEWTQTKLPIFTREQAIDIVRPITDMEIIRKIEFSGVNMVMASIWKKTGVIRNVKIF